MSRVHAVAILIFAAALLSGFVPTAIALPKAADLLKAKLLADVSTIEPGRPFTLGVLMKMSPKWHVYWINPGNSGLPPAIEWRLPSGFIVGELQFPVPARIDLPGGLVNYGYLDEVLLTDHDTGTRWLRCPRCKNGSVKTFRGDVYPPSGQVRQLREWK